MAFAPRSGCPMCSIVATAQNVFSPSSPLPSATFPISPSSSSSTAPEILWRDENFTAYLEKSNPVSSKGHVIIVLNLHVPSIYSLSSSDLPLLTQIQRTAQRLLASLSLPQAAPPSPDPAQRRFSNLSPLTPADTSQFKIGTINYPFKDNKIPVTDHLHVHAYVGTPDLANWWRKIAYGSLAWYALDDLIAEIREETTNNRVKSGYENRQNAPIDMVPAAGSRQGLPNGHELTVPTIAVLDLEDGGLESPSATSRRNSSEPTARAEASTPPQTLDTTQQ